MMKDSIIRFWLTHHYLKKIAKKYPVFFIDLIAEMTDTTREIKVMRERYVNNKKFEAIAIDMNVDVRYVFRLHRKVIDKLVKI